MTNSAFSFIAQSLTGVAFIAFLSCENKDPGPAPVITEFYPNRGKVESIVTIIGDQFIPTVPPGTGVGPHPNTSVVAFNGITAEAEYVYQDSVGKQRMYAKVPAGATTGKITVTSNGNTVASEEEFFVDEPVYLPNVEVSTVPGWGWDIEADNEGSLFLTHTNEREIIKVAQDGQVSTLWSSPGPNTPWSIAVDPNGNVFATILAAFVLKIAPDGTVTTLAGSTEQGEVDGPGATARFRVPAGIDADQDGNLYVADIVACKIRKITPDGTVSTLAGSACGFRDGTGTEAQFQNPLDLTVDAEGNVYVTDGPRIRRITSGGQVTTVAGGAAGYRDGTIADAQFSNLNGICKDPAGYLYLADEGNYVVRRVAPDGTVVTVAGSGTFGYKDGPGPSALFTQTLGLTINASGHILVTQGGGLYKIRKITIN